MKLYLTRHGEAMPDYEDTKRPLSADGIREVETIAQYMAEQGIRVSRVAHSGKKRAMQTAQILAEHIAPGIETDEIEGVKPNDPPEGLAHQATTWEQDVLVATHLPFVDRLTSLLTTGSTSKSVADFPTGATVCLERYNGDQWNIIWMITPQMLRE